MFTTEHAMKSQNSSRTVGVVGITCQPLYPWERDPVPIVQEARQNPEPVSTGAEQLTPHWDSIPGLSSP